MAIRQLCEATSQLLSQCPVCAETQCLVDTIDALFSHRFYSGVLPCFLLEPCGEFLSGHRVARVILHHSHPVDFENRVGQKDMFLLFGIPLSDALSFGPVVLVMNRKVAACPNVSTWLALEHMLGMLGAVELEGVALVSRRGLKLKQP